MMSCAVSGTPLVTSGAVAQSAFGAGGAMLTARLNAPAVIVLLVAPTARMKFCVAPVSLNQSRFSAPLTPMTTDVASALRTQLLAPQAVSRRRLTSKDVVGVAV